MLTKKQIFLVLILSPFFIFLSASEESHSSAFIEFLGKSVNFIVLFGGLAYILYKPIRSFFEKRSAQINQSIREAEVSRREFEEKLKDIKLRLAGLEDEVTKIKKKAEILGKREKERIAKLTEDEALRIKLLAQKQIEMQVIAGVQELKEYTAGLATNLAQEKIKKKLNPEDHSLLIDKSIERLALFYEKTNPD